MTVSAPATSALAMSPEYCSPPSPITGTPAGRQTRAASKIAVTCGTPTPATTRVVQIEPGPDAHLDRVGTGLDQRLGAGLGRDVAADDLHVRGGRVRLDPGRPCPAAAAPGRWRCRRPGRRRRPRPARSPAPRRRRRSRSPRPTRRRPSASLVAIGYFSVLTKSLTVISPVSRPAASTSGSFSIRCLASSAAASSRRMPSGPVTSGIGRHHVAHQGRGEPLGGQEQQVAVGHDAQQGPLGVDDRQPGDPVAAAQLVELERRWRPG